MTLVVAGVAALGTYYLYTALVLGWSGTQLGPTARERSRRSTPVHDWMAQAGLSDVAPREFIAVVGALGAIGALGGFVIFGAPLPALATAAFAAAAPIASYRLRRTRRIAIAREAWPSMIEEIRLRTVSLGRSIPQALFEVGERGPVEMRPAFAAAHREWLLTTDLDRTLDVLKSQLADPTADVTCETLLVAHEVGGADVGRRLEALAEDRIMDLQGRKDARAKQAGARLARRFVVLVPIGMALAGMQVGEGRAAYGTPAGQAVALIAIALVAACWLWAGRIMRLPDDERVFG
jgi:tight adherence protein B